MLTNTEKLTVIDKVVMPHVVDFIRHKLADYDTSLVECIKLLPLNKKAILHGCCVYPLRTARGARSFKKIGRASCRERV